MVAISTMIDVPLSPSNVGFPPQCDIRRTGAEEPSASVGFSPQPEREEDTVLSCKYPLTVAAVSHLPMLGNFRMKER